MHKNIFNLCSTSNFFIIVLMIKKLINISDIYIRYFNKKIYL